MGQVNPFPRAPILLTERAQILRSDARRSRLDTRSVSHYPAAHERFRSVSH